MSREGAVHIGTSGWMYRHWRGKFYPDDLPPRRWFAYYREHFDTVEINNTFYHLPEPEVFTEWGRQASPGFLYALKANRYLTHQKKLKDPAGPLETMLERMRRVGPSLGPILYQLPPRWRCNVERLRQFIALLPRDLTHVFEFRDPSWYNEEVRTLLTEEGMNFCIHDLRGVSSPSWATGPVVYVRFHGPTQVAYAASYPLPHLRQWARKIREFQQSGHAVYAYFNNDDSAYAVTNARQLRQLLGATPAVPAR